MDQLTGRIGRRTIQSIDYLFDLIAFTFRIMNQIIRRPKEGRALMRTIVVQQIYFTAVEALPLMIPIALITGSMLIIQFARVSEQYELGKTMVLLIVRELGPMITALLVVLRSATSVAIEISYMNVLHEMDAIEMAGLDPVRFICVPRLIGITSAILGLFIVFDLVSILGGYVVAWSLTYLPLGNFFAQISKAVAVTDIVVGIVKALFFGVTITIICLYQGLARKSKITDIPTATSKAAVQCFLFILVINGMVSILFYI